MESDEINIVIINKLNFLTFTVSFWQFAKTVSKYTVFLLSIVDFLNEFFDCAHSNGTRAQLMEYMRILDCQTAWCPMLCFAFWVRQISTLSTYLCCLS